MGSYRKFVEMKDEETKEQSVRLNVPSDPCTGPVEPEQKKSSNVLRVISVISGLLIGGKIIFYFLNSSRISQRISHSSSIESNDELDPLPTRCGLACEFGKCLLDENLVPFCKCKDDYEYNEESKACVANRL